MAPLTQHRSQRGGRRAQADEDGREAGHEQDRSDENVAPGLRFALVGQRFDARAGEKAKIRRRERQHARRNKGKEARAERGWKGNVGHGVTDGASTTVRQMARGSRPPRRGSIRQSRAFENPRSVRAIPSAWNRHRNRLRKTTARLLAGMSWICSSSRPAVLARWTTSSKLRTPHSGSRALSRSSKASLLAEVCRPCRR